MVKLSNEQESALDDFLHWLNSWDGEKGNNGRAWFSIHGPAGSGKSTIASEATHKIDRDITALAYSGKAAEVLRRKGLPANTIHSKIYKPANEVNEEADALQRQIDSGELKDSKLRSALRRLEELRAPTFILRDDNPFGDRNESLILIDEMSMANAEIGEDLQSFRIPILALGDPYQLPPIEGAGYFDKKPDIVLKEVHRQALESPVLRLATMAREGKALPSGKHGDSLVTTRQRVNRDLVVGVEQVLSGSNKARMQLNEEIRQFHGFSGLPKKGEKIICLRNNRIDGVLNGQIFELAEDVEDDPEETYLWMKLGFKDMSVKVHRECFDGHMDRIKSWDYRRRSRANEFDFAWAITVHKFQGSEADFSFVMGGHVSLAESQRRFSPLVVYWYYQSKRKSSDRAIIRAKIV